ncbi:glucosaminidase domain-containing protein [Flavobacterium sp. Sd200]|uniref:glucosaminidase domain-containing protein n=1 Tax=Flavobacterium sp. Sd200 TaxID=2692211 RepID=UPI001F02EF8A|nr:glucosaminidase domain-containing protein [Flavobacterium sp. Sd200]
MLKKILAFVLLGSIVSCSTTKPKIVTTKAGVSNKSQSTAGAQTTTRKTETLESTSKTTVYSEQVSEYVNQFKDIAQQNMKNHGVPASITLAQGILESGAGRGKLAVTANNHFGIKCHTGWDGDKIYHDDDAAQECFRKYNDASESFNDHSLFLTGRSRYANLFKLEQDDYEGWAKGLKAAGYATDPKYPDKLIGLIERFNLAQYDSEVLGGNYKPVKDVPAPVQTSVPAAVATTSAPVQTQTTTVTTTPAPVAVVTTTAPAATTTAPVTVTTTTPVSTPVADTVVTTTTPVTTPVATTVVTTPAPVATTTTATTVVTPAPSIEQAVNAPAADSYTVIKGDTLYSISKKNNTTVDALIQLNGLSGNAISIGQVLKLK